MTDAALLCFTVIGGLALVGAVALSWADGRCVRGRRERQSAFRGQTRRQSAREAVVNILVGYLVNMLANFALFPLFGWEISLAENLLIGCFYTVISLVRSYALRRYFNRRHR